MVFSKLFVAMALVLLPCAVLAAGGGQNSKVTIVGSEDNGGQISIPEGAILEVKLQQPGATGYSWEVVNLDQSRLQLIDSSSNPVKSGPVLGGPLLKKWHFRAVGKGRTELRLSLYRPWEGVDKAADNYVLMVQIQ